MQIPHSNQELFPPVQPVAASQIQQDNAQRPLIEPISETESSSTRQSATDSFTPSEKTNATELYNRQGQAGDIEKEQTANNDKTAANSAEEKDDTDKASNASSTKDVAGKELTTEQQEELQQLQRRDQEVRVHEQQHASVGGQHTGSPSYDYKTGPDGKQYVVEGSVSVDLSPIADNPNATIEKMRQVKAAALAPAEPSAADKNAAARADAHIAQATATLRQESEVRVDEDKPQADSVTTSSSSASSATTTTVKSQTDIATDIPTAKDANGDMKHRNQVIAGVYGQAAKAQSQQLLNLA